VTCVDTTIVVDDDGITEPADTPVDSVQGATIVVTTWTVVTGKLVTTAPEYDTVDAAVTMAGLEDT